MFVYNNRAWIVLSYLPLFKLDKKSKSNGYLFHKKYLNFYSSWLKKKDINGYLFRKKYLNFIQAGQKIEFQ